MLCRGCHQYQITSSWSSWNFSGNSANALSFRRLTVCKHLISGQGRQAGEGGERVLGARPEVDLSIGVRTQSRRLCLSRIRHRGDGNGHQNRFGSDLPDEGIGDDQSDIGFDLAAGAVDRTIGTVEALATDDTLAPVQQAFVDAGAVQCGFCTPGLLMTVEDLLDDNPDPTDLEMREAISGNLCRCTGYGRIFDAVNRTAQLRREAVVTIEGHSAFDAGGSRS